MSLWKAFCADEAGYVMSAELALLGTVAIVGGTVGLKMASESVNEELKDAAYSLRTLDQSYVYHGFKSRRAWTPGSHFRQDVPESLESLRRLEYRLEEEREREEARKTERLKQILHAREEESRREREADLRELRREQDERRRRRPDDDD